METALEVALVVFFILGFIVPCYLLNRNFAVPVVRYAPLPKPVPAEALALAAKMRARGEPIDLLCAMLLEDPNLSPLIWDKMEELRQQ